jgi:Holliday junction resolvase RusA-like endonuclease
MATKSSNQQAPVEFFLPGAPLPAPRPRFRVIKARNGATFGSAYYPAPYKKFLEAAPVTIRQEIGERAPLEGALEMVVHFYIERPKSTKRDTPRYDIDNYLKGLMDAMTYAGVWHDDDQVAKVLAKKSFWTPDELAPEIGTFVHVMPLDDSPERVGG